MDVNKSFSSICYKVRSEISSWVSKLQKESPLRLDLLLFIAFVSLVVLLLQ